jgi:hypothetical protein
MIEVDRRCARCATATHAEQSMDAAPIEQNRPQDPVVLRRGRTTGQTPRRDGFPGGVLDGAVASVVTVRGLALPGEAPGAAWPFTARSSPWIGPPLEVVVVSYS